LKITLVIAKHIPTFTPILVHLPEYLCEMYHFYWWHPSDVNIFDSHCNVPYVDMANPALTLLADINLQLYNTTNVTALHIRHLKLLLLLLLLLLEMSIIIVP